MKKITTLLLLVVICSQAFAVTAFFTGRMEQVTTVTYQVAWKCEYDYAGNKFWRVFKNSCPSSVEVE
jgi:hypothetical protein